MGSHRLHHARSTARCIWRRRRHGARAAQRCALVAARRLGRCIRRHGCVPRCNGQRFACHSSAVNDWSRGHVAVIRLVLADCGRTRGATRLARSGVEAPANRHRRSDVSRACRARGECLPRFDSATDVSPGIGSTTWIRGLLPVVHPGLGRCRASAAAWNGKRCADYFAPSALTRRVSSRTRRVGGLANVTVFAVSKRLRARTRFGRARP